MSTRRWCFGLAGFSLAAALIGLMVATLAPSGFDGFDLILTVLFATTLPWTVVGFLNAVVGLAILRASRDADAAVCPVTQPTADAPITTDTALVVCIRNEEVDSVIQNLEHMLAGLHRAGLHRRFQAYVLSDSDRPDTSTHEANAVAKLAERWRDTVAVTYRRRADNAGFKAGNIRDFLDRFGDRHDFMLVLDADSFMTAEAIARLVRIMEANPRLGILQSLTNGLPATSAFARTFQFGMRLGMRSYTLGAAWWQGDCGPYWGHNALVRIEPFRQHCALSPVPGSGALSGAILSHDQVEAVLMRRAGYEVRVLPIASGSYEENPPNLLEFIRRDLRWCLGNMQYLHLLRMPGLRPVSRVQLLLAILMFASSPAWLAFLAVGALRMVLVDHPYASFDPTLGTVLFACVLGMIFAPKLATVVDVILRPEERRAFGGGARLLASVLGEVVFSTLLAPIMAIAHTFFLVGLPFGRRATWAAQRRDVHEIEFGNAWQRLWPQFAFGVSGLVWVAECSSVPLWSVLPVVLGPLLATPFAMLTASRQTARMVVRTKLWQTPEEASPPADLAGLLLADDRSCPDHVISAAAEAALPPVCAAPLPALATTGKE